MTSELDEAAVEAMAQALWMGRLLRGDPDLLNVPWEQVDDTRDVQIAYEAQEIRADARVALAAAARPTPDAAAMEREEQAFRIELDRFALCAEKASIWYPTDEYHTKRTLERDNKRQELIEMFRKAATR